MTVATRTLTTQTASIANKVRTATTVVVNPKGGSKATQNLKGLEDTMARLTEVIATEANRRARQGFCASVEVQGVMRQGCGTRDATRHARHCEVNTNPMGFAGLPRKDAEFRAFHNWEAQQPGFWEHTSLEIDLMRGR